MAKPRVFVSSTYYDLKHVRASVEVFVESLGFEPILAEYGSIAFDPSQPLDESCYREAQSSDIFVLIIGGRYGSIVSSLTAASKLREEELESITRKEFSKAHDADIPVFVLIEHGVHAEYQTYLRNKENDTIKYASVDSSRIFRFIEFVYSKQRNNPVHPFEKGSDIEYWLREQWAGIFQELLRQRKDNGRFSDLASQIRQLEAVNSTLKSYLETVLQSVSPNNSEEIIEKENRSLSRSIMLEQARKNNWFDFTTNISDLPVESVLDAHLAMEAVSDIYPVFDRYIANASTNAEILEVLARHEAARQDFNKLRRIIGLKGLRFTSKMINNFRVLSSSLRDSPDDISNDSSPSDEIEIDSVGSAFTDEPDTASSGSGHPTK